MYEVSIRNFLHDFSNYKKKVLNGERLIITDHNIPIMDLVPHADKTNQPGWKRKHYVLPKGKKSASDTVINLRDGERY